MENSAPFIGTGMDNCNCNYTTSNGRPVKMSLDALLKIMEDIPEKPKIFTMPINIVRHDILPTNTIYIGNDIADAIESALQKERKDN